VLSSGFKLEFPVILPPGRARLAIKPELTGVRGARDTDGNGRSCFFRRGGRRHSYNHNQFNLFTNQIRRKLGGALRLLLGKPILDGDILSLDPSKLAQLLPERFQENRAARSSAIIQKTDAKGLSRRLRQSHRPTQSECDTDGNKRHHYILDFRFWIVGPETRISHPGFLMHLFFSTI
jgi:hypothetical protein